jgi:hypothetical protein
MRITAYFYLAAFLLPSVAVGAEGMWTLDNLPRAALQSDFGFQPDAAWVEKVQKSSVRLAGGCSGSFASPDGLVLTNHHCIWRCVEQLSTTEHNYMRDGFLARAHGDELQCPNTELNQLTAITDVTERVWAATEGQSGEAFVAAQRAEMSRIEQACAGDDPTVRCDVVTLYHGGLYHLYRYQRYDDVRLVWAPELKASLFGGDPDNFNFPRYSLDASVLRAWRDGKPAATPDHFSWNKAGAVEDELVFVTGHPGSTQRLLTVTQLELRRDLTLVDQLLYLAELRGLLNHYATLGDAQKLHSQYDILMVENSYKAIRGRLQALKDPAVFEFKRAEERMLRDWVAADPARIAEFGSAWDEIAQAQDAYRALHRRYTLIEQSRGFRGRLYSIARGLVRAADERQKPSEERLREYRDTALQSLAQNLLSPAPIHADYERLHLAWSLTKLREELGADDPLVRAALGNDSPADLARTLVEGTKLFDLDYRRALWEGGAEAVAASDDPLIAFVRRIDGEARAVRAQYENEVGAAERANQQRIARVLFELKGTDAYPDATFTLRLSYGQVRGWEEHDRKIGPFTVLAGAFERHTGADPFALPDSWFAARPQLDMDQPVNFVTTHDIIGGNSGSPVINRDAEVVGLVFDGNIHSLGGDYWYDQRLNRAVSVHSGLIIHALRHIYDAGELLRELGQ